MKFLKCPRRERGATLIEVMIAIILAVIGLLSMLQLQLGSVSNTHSAYLRSQAVIGANDALDLLRANTKAALAGNYNMSLGSTPSSPIDLKDWHSNLVGSLPDGKVSINCSGIKNECTVVVQWNDERAVEGSATQQFTVKTRL